ncbi:uncharacterized protein At5g39865-like [Malania oleifera]|uniref:uncharacterized protein At5g39865-like n=1 Tax=Malania oleifera TaxID=397392 RepID=UPI0025ADE262|nr:uncharacterized protein At5g39865-like [Malania oleifera]
MKGVKGRFLRKLKYVSTINTLKQGLVIQLNPPEKLSNQNFQTPSSCKEEDYNNHLDHVPGHISVLELINDLEAEEMESNFHLGHKERLGRITTKSEFTEAVPTKDNSEITAPSVHGCENTVPLADVVTESKACNLEQMAAEQINIKETEENDEESPSLLEFEERCPPGGSDSVILYTTSLRGIRKTFEDCGSIRFLLESFRVFFYERDVAMHLEFREELWRILGGRVVPPRLFIKGRHIGGADEVVGLHEQGKLRKLLQGIPLAPLNCRCDGCTGARFVVCFNCSGSCKVFEDESDHQMFTRCSQCNENGLIKCPICC